MKEKIKVLLSTEGTYPFHQGGVSTWCDILVNQMPGCEFSLFSIIMNPYVTQKFSLPPGTELIKVPLWGTEEPSEHLAIPFSQVYLAKKRTSDEIIRERFLPLFSQLVDEFLARRKDPGKLGSILMQLHDYFEEYEYKASFKSKIVWERFKEQINGICRDKSNGISEPSIFAMTQSLGWIYRFFNILNTPIPKVDVTHSAAAAFCGVPCVLAKLKYGTPFVLTEHGVYLREQYFSLSQRGYVGYMNTFLIRMILSVTGLSYFYADMVSPVCGYNTRWETEFGVPQKNIRVIYNGVDKNVFSPGLEERSDSAPTIVTVARIDPLKDIKTLLRAAAIVKSAAPEVVFKVFGSVSVEAYYKECLDLRQELGLVDSFIFEGHVVDVAKAYRQGDIVALSSISEAFPYSVVEAMLVGKPVIATDVGGIREALGESGILVDPRNPLALADGMLKLLNNSSLRSQLGEEARDRALTYFTLERVTELYHQLYSEMAASARAALPDLLRQRKQKLLLEKGMALVQSGFYKQGIQVYNELLKTKPSTQLTAFVLSEISRAMTMEGDFLKANLLMDKALALDGLITAG